MTEIVYEARPSYTHEGAYVVVKKGSAIQLVVAEFYKHEETNVVWGAGWWSITDIEQAARVMRGVIDGTEPIGDFITRGKGD